MAAAVERRFTQVTVEVRAGAVDRRTVGGYAAKFNQRSKNLGGFIEMVTPPFFNRDRGNGWGEVICRYNHNDDMLLGTIAGRTLRLSIDETGLLYEADLPQSRADVFELIQRGDVAKSSFAFRLYPDGDEWGLSPDEGYPMRKLVSGQLVDVAPVNIPAYSDSSVGTREHLGQAETAVALRSLAAKCEADVDEVVAAAVQDELRRFLTVTGSDAPMPKPKPRTFGAAAMVALLEKKTDPWGEQ